MFYVDYIINVHYKCSLLQKGGLIYNMDFKQQIDGEVGAQARAERELADQSID